MDFTFPRHRGSCARQEIAQKRRRRADHAGCSTEFDGKLQLRDPSFDGVVDMEQHLAMAHLRILERFLH